MEKLLKKPDNKAKCFTDLFVWQKAHQFVQKIYLLTEQFPKTEQYGLTSQLRRAAVSIPANIAEGFGRNTLKDKLRFLTISKGSLEECRYYLILANDINYAQTEDVLEQLEEVSKILSSSASKLKNIDVTKM
jgi:four helix bundle protein